MKGKGHGLVLYLAPELVLSLAKLQTVKELGRSYAGLLALTEGFYQLGVLSDVDYEEAKARYSVSLLQKNKKPPTLKQLREKEELKRLEQHYSRVLEQWSTLNEKTKTIHEKKAAKDAKRVNAAKLVLDLASGSEVE